MIKVIISLVIAFSLIACATSKTSGTQSAEGKQNQHEQRRTFNEEASKKLLHLAGQLSKEDTLKLLSQRADPNYADESGHVPLHAAIHANNLPAIETLLAQGALTEVATRAGITPLSAAVKSGNSELVELLLAHGAKVNFSPSPQVSPLYTAILDNALGILEALIAAGADVNLTYEADELLIFPLLLASDLETFTLLAKQGSRADYYLEKADETPFLFSLIASANLALLESALEHGADPNMRSRPNRETPLHFAIAKRDLDAVKILLKYGADIHSRDIDERTPMDYAVLEELDEAIALIRKARRP